MSKFNTTHCRAGHKVICNLIDASKHNRATGEEIAAGMNAELKLDPESREAWTVDDVKCAVYEGAFDSKARHFSYYRGRYGGYREYDAEAMATQLAANAEAERQKEERARKRREKKEAKEAAKAAPAETPVMEETSPTADTVPAPEAAPEVNPQPVESAPVAAE